MEVITYIAHRGLHDKKTPENSISAFLKANKLKLPIELDVQLTSDDQVVVFHDKSLERLVGIKKNISLCTYEELRKYKIKGSNERIPLLKEVLDLIDGTSFLDIEIKHYKRIFKLVIMVSDLMHNYNGKYQIKSFNPLIPYLYKRKNPHIKCGVLVGSLDKTKLPKFIKRFLLDLKYLWLYKPDFIAYNIEEVNDKIIKKIDKYNIPLHLYTIDTLEKLKRARKLSNTIIFEKITIEKD